MGANCGELDATSKVKIIMVDPIGLLLVAMPLPISVNHAGPMPPSVDRAFIKQYGGTKRSDRINIVPSISPSVWRHMIMSPLGLQYLSGKSTDIDDVVAQMAELPMVRNWIMAQKQQQEQEHVEDSSKQKQIQRTMTMTMMQESVKRMMEWERRTGLKEVPEMVAALRDELAAASSRENKLIMMCVSNMTRDELR
jgi:hypothetical protein